VPKTGGDYDRQRTKPEPEFVERRISIGKRGRRKILWKKAVTVSKTFRRKRVQRGAKKGGDLLLISSSALSLSSPRAPAKALERPSQKKVRNPV